MKNSFLPCLRRFLSLVLAVVLATDTVPPAFCQTMAGLFSSERLLSVTAPFSPPLLKGIRVFPADPLRFDFIMDQGEHVLSGEDIRFESSRLIRYFFAGLTIPEKDLWVNLSPYEQERIIPEAFGRTEMGRDLLSQDYFLKQLTASLIYPEAQTGREFWRKLYALARARYGTTDIPLDVFNKVWIVPEQAELYENSASKSACIISSRLKVMLEQDYLAEERSQAISKGALVPASGNGAQDIAREVMREIVVPLLEKEINEGRSFSRLRQVYYSVLLAAWYKRALKESLLATVYVDRRKTSGVDIEDPQETRKIWQRYQEAFLKGTYNLVRDEKDWLTDELVPRKYFGGGVVLNGEYHVRDNAREEVFALRPVLVSCKAKALPDASQASGLLAGIPALLSGESGSKSLQDFLEGLLQDKDIVSDEDLWEQLKPYVLEKKFVDALELALLVQGARLSGEENIEERRRLARVAGMFFAPYLDVRTDSWQEAWKFFVDDQQILLQLLRFAALLRKIYPFQHFPGDPPLQKALEAGIYYRLAGNLFITPASHSFRKHLLFATGSDGELIFAVELMVPGERADKYFIGADNRMRIAGEIEKVWAEEKIQSVPLKFLEKETFALRMYGKDMLFDPGKKFQVLFMEYPFDGVRMNFFSDRKIRYRYAQDLGVSIRDLAREIIAKTAEAVASYEALDIVGFIGIGFDAHTGNLRVSFLQEGQQGDSWRQRVKVSTVSDYYGFQKLPETSPDKELSFLTERRLYIEGAAGTPGLSEIFYESEYSRRDYYNIFRQAYEQAKENVQQKNERSGQRPELHNTIALVPVNLPDTFVRQALETSTPGGIDLSVSRIKMQVSSRGTQTGSVSYDLSAQELRRLESAPGIAPDITGIYSGPDLKVFFDL